MSRSSGLLAFATCVLAVTNATTWWLMQGRTSSGAHDAVLCNAELESVELQRDRLQEELRARECHAPQREEPAPVAHAEGAHQLAVPQANAALRAALAVAPRPPALSSQQLQFTSRRRYGQLFEELELSETQIAALLRTLAQQEQRSAPPRAADPAEREHNQAEIAAAIGADKAAQFERLKQTLPARSELRQVRDQLEELGRPLSDEQYRDLIAIVSTQPPNPPPTHVAGEAPDVGMERLRNWFSERDRRFRTASTHVLTPEQQQSLEDGESVRKAMSSASSLALGRNQLQAGSGG